MLQRQLPGAIRKLNDREALRLCGERGDAAEPFLGAAARAADALFGRWNEPVLLTRGARGILVRDARGTRQVPGLHILGSPDAVGAGDSATAGIAAALAAGADIMEAAELGNFAAGVSVQKLFTTGAATPRKSSPFERTPPTSTGPSWRRIPGAPGTMATVG